MTESTSNRFTKYFPLLLDALRSTHPAPMRPPEARAWIRSKIEVLADDLTRHIKHGKQSIFENDVHWARFYLAKANLIASLRQTYLGLIGLYGRPSVLLAVEEYGSEQQEPKERTAPRPLNSKTIFAAEKQVFRWSMSCQANGLRSHPVRFCNVTVIKTT